MIVDDDGLIFNTGHKVYANGGIVGINGRLSISEGYDSDLDEEDLTESEKSELATYMIDLWEKWRAKWVRQ